MKVCYLDESGNAEDPCLIMVGILVDAARLNRTNHEFSNIFADAQDLFGENLRELKGAKVLFGRDGWRKIEANRRKEILESCCKWINQRKHRLVLAAIDREKLNERILEGVAKEPKEPWLAAGLHIALQIQKANQKNKKNKGNTFLIFDDNKKMADKFSDLLWQPPEWTNNYYDKKRGQEDLDQIINTAFSIKSNHAGLVQAADIFAVLLRRYVEIEDFGVDEKWAGEKNLLDRYVEMLAERLLPRPVRWSLHTKNEAIKWYTGIAPDSLTKLG